MKEFTQILLEAADLADGVRQTAEVSQEACQLISMLGYGDGDRRRAGQRAGMLRMAARLKRLFTLPAPDAPGLVFFGGEADPSLVEWHGSGHGPISLAGSGLSTRQAFEACVGEGVEYLSQFAAGADVGRQQPFARMALKRELGTNLACVLKAVGIRTDQPIAWVALKSLCDGSVAWLPADVCLRRSAEQRDFTAPFKLSTGCGAGATFEDAVVQGLCELIERDAVALWWRGGHRGRAIAADSAAGRAGAELLASLRGGSTRRTSWLLDITTDVGLPCVAAISVGSQGREFACGHAARPTRAAAVRSAIFEMCQIELGQAVIAAKQRERGVAALNSADLAHLRRASLIDPGRCVLLQPDGSPVVDDADAPTLQEIVERLVVMGIEPLVLDLTRPMFGIPVARVVTPGLQLDPSPIISDRLARTIHATGGAEAFTGGMPLL